MVVATLDEHGLPVAKGPRLEGTFSAKFNAEDWNAISNLMEVFSSIKGDRVSISDAVRAAIHQTHKRYRAQQQEAREAAAPDRQQPEEPKPMTTDEVLKRRARARKKK